MLVGFDGNAKIMCIVVEIFAKDSTKHWKQDDDDDVQPG